MPGCFRGKEDGEGPDKVSDRVPGSALPHQDWREPPGYLGEAVRRVKRISGIASQASKPLGEDWRED